MGSGKQDRPKKKNEKKKDLLEEREKREKAREARERKCKSNDNKHATFDNIHAKAECAQTHPRTIQQQNHMRVVIPLGNAGNAKCY